MSAVSRITASVAVAGCMLLLPGIASAQTPWRMDYLSGWSSNPSPLREGDAAAITLRGWFPYDCGWIDRPTVVDSGALWLVILIDSPEALRRAALRWLLIAALLAGLISETRWIFVMAGPSGKAGHSRYGIKDWLVWLALLLGPLIQSLYYLAKLIGPGMALATVDKMAGSDRG